MQHSWKAYETYAWGYDELMPLNKSGTDNFGGLGATIIDSLDTLHMMGLTAELKRCANFVYVCRAWELSSPPKLCMLLRATRAMEIDRFVKIKMYKFGKTLTGFE